MTVLRQYEYLSVVIKPGHMSVSNRKSLCQKKEKNSGPDKVTCKNNLEALVQDHCDM